MQNSHELLARFDEQAANIAKMKDEYLDQGLLGQYQQADEMLRKIEEGKVSLLNLLVKQHEVATEDKNATKNVQDKVASVTKNVKDKSKELAASEPAANDQAVVKKKTSKADRQKARRAAGARRDKDETDNGPETTMIEAERLTTTKEPTANHHFEPKPRVNEVEPTTKKYSKNCDAKAHKKFLEQCKALKAKYKMYDREEWWWLMDDSIDTIGAHLGETGYCYIDGFLHNGQALNKEVNAVHMAGRLKPGMLVNGRKEDIEEAKYLQQTIRGDSIGWFEPDEDKLWTYGDSLKQYLVKLGTLISELARVVPELSRIQSRSQAMVSFYPGTGARYSKHVDNDGKHPLCKRRILTAIMYLNPTWAEGDGGELVVYAPEASSGNRDLIERCVVSPLLNRLLLFWSDWRTPHEVTPAKADRYAVTIWFLDKDSPPEQPSISEPMSTVEAEEVEESEESKAPKHIGSLFHLNAADEKKDVGSLDDIDDGLQINSDSLESTVADSTASRDKNDPKKKAQAAEGRASCQIVSPGAMPEERLKYEWNMEDSDSASLFVDVLPGDHELEGPPQVEISECQIRLHWPEIPEAPRLVLPLPFPSDEAAQTIKWSRKKQRMTIGLCRGDSGPKSKALAGLPLGLNKFVASMVTDGRGILDGVLQASEADELRRFVLNLWSTGRLKAGSNSHEGADPNRARKNDAYAFLEDSEFGGKNSPLRLCCERADKLMLQLTNQVPELRGRSLLRGKPMAAVYPGGGSRYVRHFDASGQANGRNGRVLTTILYLNPHWKPGSGGELLIFDELEDEEAKLEVAPLHGRFTAFLCDSRNPHEVVASNSVRLAVTIWYYDAERLEKRMNEGQGDIQGIFEQ